MSDSEFQLIYHGIGALLALGLWIFGRGKNSEGSEGWGIIVTACLILVWPFVLLVAVIGMTADWLEDRKKNRANHGV